MAVGLGGAVLLSSKSTQYPRTSPEAPTPAVASSDPVIYLSCLEDGVSSASKAMLIESALPLFVNGQHWLTVLCTPTQLDHFVIGFLFNEGLIATRDDIVDLKIGPPPEMAIWVELRKRDVRLPQHPTLTSGCGGGITFVDLAASREPVSSTLHVTPHRVLHQMACLMAIVADDYRRVGGFHTAGLSDGQRLLAVATDIGRHNTLDKIAGECLARNIAMRECMLLATGRISAEMMAKAARMRVPVVVTVNSPSHLAVELARSWHITLIGYAQGSKMHVYSGWQRVSGTHAVGGASTAESISQKPVSLSPTTSPPLSCLDRPAGRESRLH